MLSVVRLSEMDGRWRLFVVRLCELGWQMLSVFCSSYSDVR